MKITMQQICLLFDVLKDTLSLGNNRVFSLSDKTRLDLYQKILNQQDQNIMDLPDDEWPSDYIRSVKKENNEPAIILRLVKNEEKFSKSKGKRKPGGKKHEVK